MDIDTEPSLTPSAETLTRADGLWFQDCGLIIQAESTIFRVSRDILAVQSPVFKDMLAIPPPETIEMMEGCPLVRLPDDADDVDPFLRAIFYYDFFEPHPAATTFPVLSSILLLSDKYEVEVLRKRALIHFSSGHPTTLREWDSLEGERPSWYPDDTDIEIDVVNLARTIGADWMLPTTFYRIIQSSREETIIAGIGGRCLSSSDKIHCLQATRFLETTAAADVLNFFWTHDEDDCLSPDDCGQARNDSRRRAEDRRKYSLDSAIVLPLELWTTPDWNDLDDACEPCLSAMKAMHRRTRKSVWDQLPGLLGLPTWEKLEKMKADALN